MDKMMDKMNPKRMKAVAAAFIFVKIFGIGRSLLLLLGGVIGYTLGMKCKSMDKGMDEE